ncbi:MAG: ABC transporter substrate-binding protein [Candidatus Lambdaproteobacteria bacterium]|nr:ABC transporter substrate-binding protein [Candidatus Lambdaproteobacteria bacterium]
MKIGYVGGISGVCGSLTPPAIKAMKMATEEINNAGGIMGRPVEVIYRDSKTKPDEGAKQARDLIVSDKVEIITGVCSSSIFMSVFPVTKEYNIPLFSALSGTHKPNIDFFYPGVFQTQPHTIIEGKALAEFTKQKGWKKIVTMAMDYEWGRTTIEVYKDHLAQIDPSAKIVKELWPKFGESNMTSFITATLADQPDAVIAVTAGVTTNSLIKQGKAYGLFDRTKVVAFLVTQTLMDMGTEVPDGIYGWSRAPFNALGTARGADFVKRYRARYDGEYPTDWGVLGYDVMYFIKEVVTRAGNTKSEDMSKAAASFTFDSVRGQLRSRTLDNTLDSPSYIGITKKTPEYPFPILTDVTAIPGSKLLPSEAEVLKMRAMANK